MAKEYVSPAGYHRHSCYDCEHVWEHSDDNQGSVEAHTCPKCGAEPSEQGDPFAPLFDHRFQNWCHYEGPKKPARQRRRAA